MARLSLTMFAVYLMLAPSVALGVGQLHAYFPLDEGTGSTTADVYGPATGTLTGFGAVDPWNSSQTAPIDGSNPYSLTLGVNNGYVDLGDLGFDYGAISVWVNPTALTASDARLFGQPSGPSTQSGSVRFDNSGNVLFWNGSAWLNANNSPSLNTNVWQHLVFNTNGTTTDLYIDGVPQATFAGSMDYDGVPFGLGARYLNLYGTPVDAHVDELALFSEQLTQDEISLLASGVRANFIPLSPEPGSLYLLGLVLVVLALFYWRRLASTAAVACVVCIFAAPAQADPIYATEILSKSPVAYWRLGESAGPSIVDETGNNNGTAVNLAPSAFGQPGAIVADTNTAIEFNGSNSYIDGGNDPSLNGAFPGLSILAWIRPDNQSGTQLVAGKWSNTVANDHFGLFVSNGNPLLAVADGTSGESGLASPTAVPADEWSFVVGTWDGTTEEYRLYIDGGLVATGSQGGSGINTTSATAMRIGAQTTGPARYFDGSIDEVAIFGTALTDTEIAELYALALRTGPPLTPEPGTLLLILCVLPVAVTVGILRRKQARRV